MLVPQVVTKAVLSGVKLFAVGTGMLALVGMAFFEMSVLASPMFELSRTFGASIRCRRRAIQGVVFSSGRIL
jgi:hypothetical protein